MKKRYVSVILFLFLALILTFVDLGFHSSQGIQSIRKITGSAISQNGYPQETGIEPIVLFSPRDNCLDNLLALINASTTIHCAFFDIDIPELVAALQAKNASVVVDNDNTADWPDAAGMIRYDNNNQLSHNKFCIFDNMIVWTGSLNPTKRGTEKNNNNAVILQSRYLADNYEQEFQELWSGAFGKGDPVYYPQLEVNGRLAENYFCPEDSCAGQVIKTISLANESIYFMAFSFTHDGIGQAVLDAANRSVEVHGIMEKSKNNKYHEFEKLASAGLDVSWDTNPANMHHKVFIIDKKIVVTGSFNPSKNADERNDENVIILHDPGIAKKFLEEYAIVAQWPLALALS